MQDIINLVKLINNIQGDDDINPICDITTDVIHNILHENKDPYFNLSVLYRLIFATFKMNPDVSYQLLNGFLKFGQSPAGQKYKPMFDFFIMEAFDGLVRQGGWSILKNCVNFLFANLKSVRNEPIFKHILLRITDQLYKDITETNPENISDICYNLPREKSFSWGWFSYYIACAYYSRPHSLQTTLNATKTRKYLMNYRQMITYLRRNVVNVDMSSGMQQAAAAGKKINDIWSNILNAVDVPEYQWAVDVIRTVTNQSILRDISGNVTSHTCSSTLNELKEVLHKMDIVSAPIEIMQSSAEESITKESSTNVVVTKESSTEESSTNVVVTKESSTNVVVTKESSTEESSTEESSTNVVVVTNESSMQSSTNVVVTKESSGSSSWFSWLGWA